MRAIKVVVVESDASSRLALVAMLKTAADVSVVALASDVMQARMQVKLRQPDVVLIAINQHTELVDQFLTELLAAHPLAVLMLSDKILPCSASERQTLRSGGAMIMKPVNGIQSQDQVLAQKIILQLQRIVEASKSSEPTQSQSVYPQPSQAKPTWPKPTLPKAAQSQSKQSPTVQSESKQSPTVQSESKQSPTAQPQSMQSPTKQSNKAAVSKRAVAASAVPSTGGAVREGKKHHPIMNTLLAIGASTGGTNALRHVVNAFPVDFSAVVIVQHLPKAFAASFIDKLNKASPMHVVSACDGHEILHGHVYVGAGDEHFRIEKQGSTLICRVGGKDKISGHCPSVNALFDSVAKHVGSKSVGALMTGMGEDGATGLKKMREARAKTVAQDKESSVVWGMPGAAVKLGAAEIEVPLDQLGDQLVQLVQG